MSMGSTRMSHPNPTQLQNQYLPPGQFPGSSPGRGPGAVGMNQPGAQTAVPVVRNEPQFFLVQKRVGLHSIHWNKTC